MAQRFPFGRGGRGSRQRLYVEVLQKGGAMKIREVVVGILQTHEPNVVVARVGISLYAGKRRMFFTSQIFETLRAGKQAVKDFKTIRRINKIIIDKPRPA